MIKNHFLSVFLVMCTMQFTFSSCASAQGASVDVHLRGVRACRISLLYFTRNGTFNQVMELNDIQNGGTGSLEVEKEYLPGEFILRFDYTENPAGISYPAEKRIFISNQDLELWVNPKYCNNTDSTWFQEGELENKAFEEFANKSLPQREKITLLQQFLMNYDDTRSKFFREGVSEYEKQRKSYNRWLTNCIMEDRELFVSSLYRFQYIPFQKWEGTETEKSISMIDHYFDEMDFTDPAVIKTSLMNEWMNNYVNHYGQLAATAALRDSLIPEAGRKAIEKARSGHPEVYGWMVDYFYRGFEVNNIPAGMKVLEPYIIDPNCLTFKKSEIERRLKGLETLLAGNEAPEIELNESDGTIFNLYACNPSSRYLLLFFWSAGCSHCKEMIEKLYPWQQQPEVNKELTVVAISLDETETEIKSWQRIIEKYNNWVHLRAPEGVRSKVAADYFVLSTPLMILLDAGTKEIIDLPDTLLELKTYLHTGKQTDN